MWNNYFICNFKILQSEVTSTTAIDKRARADVWLFRYVSYVEITVSLLSVLWDLPPGIWRATIVLLKEGASTPRVLCMAKKANQRNEEMYPSVIILSTGTSRQTRGRTGSMVVRTRCLIAMKCLSLTELRYDVFFLTEMPSS
jgi:hypothetical protein